MQSGSQKVLQNLFKQKICGTFCDVQLHIQGTVLWSHACVLASCSPYFMDYLKQKIDEGDHWSARQPLVITLDDLSKDICFICVSKIIDFLYLRELIVLKGHFEHFSKIVNILKVLDLLPFCKINFEVENSKHIEINKSLKNNDQHKISTNKENVRFKNKLESSVKTVNCLELTSHKTKIEKSLDLSTQDLRSKTDSIISSTVNVEDIKTKTSNNICEFSCCSSDLNNSSICEMKQRRKRKMFCELCSFSSISVKNILKHVQSENHLGKVCPVCNLEAENTGHLTLHLKDHYNSKPFICHICQKRTRFWHHHNLHLRVHCRNKGFNCDICQRRFKFKKNLSIHLSTHKYVCKKCGNLSADEKSYQIHQLLHSNGKINYNCVNTQQLKEGISTVDKQTNDHKPSKFEKVRNFECYVCSEKFTLQKNLSRHIQLKHYCTDEYKCTNCTYLTKRYDLLKDHMKRHHNCLPPDKTKLKKKNLNSKIKQNQESSNQNGIVGVLIPVELVAVDGSKTLNAFAVKTDSSEIPGHEESQYINHNKEETFNNDILLQSQVMQSKCSNINNEGEGNFQSFVKEPNLLPHDNTSDFSDKHPSSEEIQKEQTNLEKNNCWNCNAGEIASHLIDNSDNIWLNEATGEFLSGTNFISIPKIDTEYSVDKNNCMKLRTEKSSVVPSDFEESLPSLILNEAGSNLPSYEVDDDNPQTNLMDLDNQDNLFPWESLGDNFCSTWVLNESTGELNMVSFGVQPLKNCNKLKLDENTGTFLSADDDETALFLNEGTGDLSVIYFNPNKSYSDSSNYFINDQLTQEKLETMSQHSNDEDDWLNEEFLRASTDFMAQDENETFLNELTGEFDVTCQFLGNECIYLNEETGEISHNVRYNTVNNDVLTNADPFRFDFDDSLNCEDFEHFSTEMNEFSSQFCLDKDKSNNWHNFDESSDIMLNECTGELVKRC